MAKGRKTGGRAKGTPNEVTRELREMVSTFLTDNWDMIQKDFEQLEPKDRLMFYERLLSYGLPKLQRTEVKTDEKLIRKIPAWLLETPEGSTV